MESGVTYGGGGNEFTGTFTEPGVANVESGVSYGGGGNEFTGTFAVPGIAGVLDSVSYGGGGSEFTGTLGNCASNGGQGCYATGSYFAAQSCGGDDSNCFVPSYVASTQPLKAISFDAIDAGKGSIRTSLTLSGVAGTLADCAANGADDCVVDSASSFDAADLTNLSPSNIRDGISIAGTTGTIELPAATDVEANVSYGAGGTELTGSFGVPANSEVEQGITFGGGGSEYTGTAILESHSDCTGANQTGCIATTTYKTLDLSTVAGIGLTSSNFDTSVATAATFEFWDALGARHTIDGDGDLVASNLKASVEIHGVTGNVTPTPADCSSNGSQSCVATGSYYAASVCGANGADGCYLNPAGSYDAADLTNLSAGNIKRGVTIAGTTGEFPSSTSPLPRYSDSGATTGTSGSDEADLDSATFTAKLKSSTAFEYWDSTGRRYQDAGDADIVSENLPSGVSIFGTSGNLPAPQCLATTQGPCEADSACRWTGSACEINPWNIRYGITIADQTGITKQNCRNRINSSIFNSDSMPPGNLGTTAGSSMDWWDTIDHHNGNDPLLPSDQPSGWSAENLCGKELWSDVTLDGACDESDDDCVIQNNVTNQLYTEDYPVSGSAPASTTVTWSEAVDHCNSLNYGGRTDWRLPTQVELSLVYAYGLRSVGYSGNGTIRPGGDTLANNDYFISNVDVPFWSATHRGSDTSKAFRVVMSHGTSSNSDKTNGTRVICTAP